MKWEYKAILISDSVQGLPNRLLLSLTLNKLLNELSDWELVTVDNGIAYFKRPNREHISEIIKKQMGKPPAIIVVEDEG